MLSAYLAHVATLAAILNFLAALASAYLAHAYALDGRGPMMLLGLSLFPIFMLIGVSLLVVAWR